MHRADKPTPPQVPIVLKSGGLNLLEPSGSVQDSKGVLFLYLHICPKTATTISSCCPYFVTSYVRYKQKIQTPYVTVHIVNRTALGPTQLPTGVTFLINKTAGVEI